jgi:hypothetical protein
MGHSTADAVRAGQRVTDYSIALVIASPIVAAVTFCLLLAIGRGLRGCTAGPRTC